jgi:hypothetical protein
VLCQLSYTHHRAARTNHLQSLVGPPTVPTLLGAPEGTRTPDPRLRRPLLCPPELLARIGASRFERPTPCSQGRCATRLRHAPIAKRLTQSLGALNRVAKFHRRPSDQARNQPLLCGRRSPPHTPPAISSVNSKTEASVRFSRRGDKSCPPCVPSCTMMEHSFSL